MSKKKNKQKHQQKKTSIDTEKTLSKEEQQQAEHRNKQKEIIFTVIIIVVLLVLAVIGLWKLSGEGNKPSDKLVFTVGEEEVYLDEVNLCILQNVVNLKITADSLDDTTAEDGSSADAYYKKEILELIMNYKVEYMTAKKQGIELSEEEEKSVRSDAVLFMGSINGSILHKLGITQDRVIEIYKQQYMAKKLEETVTRDIEVEDQNYCTIYMMLFPKIQMTEDGDYERQEDGETPIMLSDEEISKRKEEADAAYQELVAGAKVEDVAEKYGVAAFSSEESNLADSFGEPFSQYAKSLRENEYSPVIDIESCYAIIKMINVNNKELADQILSHYKADLEKDRIAEEQTKWYEEAGIGTEPDFKGDIWKKVSLYDFTQYVEE